MHNEAQHNAAQSQPIRIMETTIGSKNQTLEEATRTESAWHNPEMGYHAQVVKTSEGYQVRLVIN